MKRLEIENVFYIHVNMDLLSTMRKNGASSSYKEMQCIVMAELWLFDRLKLKSSYLIILIMISELSDYVENNHTIINLCNASQDNNAWLCDVCDTFH